MTRKRTSTGTLLSGRFKSQRTAQVESAFEERTRKLEERARELHPEVVLQEVSTLRLDGGTQPRVKTDEQLAQAYAERMVWDASAERVVDTEGEPFEPITFYDDGAGSLWLADGFHRVLAAKIAGIPRIQARRLLGDQHAAFIYSLGANATHGKRRSNADKRRAVERALQRAALRKLTDRRLSTICKVSNRFVSTVRAELESNGDIPFEAELEKADGSTYERLDGPPKQAPTPRASEPLVRKTRHDSKTTVRSVKVSARKTLQTRCAVAFTSQREELGAHLARGDARPETLERLLVPYPERFEALGELDAEVRQRLGAPESWHGPWPVYVRDHDRIYAMWSKTASMPVSASCAQLGGEHGARVWGEPTEQW